MFNEKLFYKEEFTHYVYISETILKNPLKQVEVEEILHELPIASSWADCKSGEVHIIAGTMGMKIEEIESKLAEKGIEISDRKEVRENE